MFTLVKLANGLYLNFPERKCRMTDVDCLGCLGLLEHHPKTLKLGASYGHSTSFD